MAQRLRLIPETDFEQLQYMRKQQDGCERVDSVLNKLYPETKELTERAKDPPQPPTPPPRPPTRVSFEGPTNDTSQPPPVPTVEEIVEPTVNETETTPAYSVERLIDIFSTGIKSILRLLERCKIGWNVDTGVVTIGKQAIPGSNIVHVLEALVGGSGQALEEKRQALQYQEDLKRLGRKRAFEKISTTDPNKSPSNFIETRASKKRRLQQAGEGLDIPWTSY